MMFFDHETKELVQDEDAGDDEVGASESAPRQAPACPALQPLGTRNDIPSKQ